jgi:heme iron utilization protein
MEPDTNGKTNVDRQGDDLTGASGRLSSLANAAREIVRASTHGALATLTTEGGFPYASLVELMPTEDGDVVMFLSRLAEHQHYLAVDSRASVLIAPAMGAEHALARERVTLVGHAELVEDRMAFADAYAALHPDARGYINFPDFQFYHLRVERVRYIAGFGQMGWIEGDTYRAAGAK